MSPTPTLPDPEKEALWRQRVAAQAASDLTVRDWCRQEGYSDSLFHYWKSTIAKRDGVYAPPPRKAPAPQSPAKAQPAFAQVVVREPSASASPAPPPSAHASTSAAIEIALPGARIVRVNVGFDAATLARVLALLEGRPC